MSWRTRHRHLSTKQPTTVCLPLLTFRAETKQVRRWASTTVNNATIMKTLPASHRPVNVLNALRLLIFCLAIELLGFAFSGDYSIASVLSVLVGAALSFWLLRRLHAGENWARFALALVVGLGAVTLLVTFREEYVQNPGATVIDAISTLLTFVAIGLLFSRQSNQWFRHDTLTNRV